MRRGQEGLRRIKNDVGVGKSAVWGVKDFTVGFGESCSLGYTRGWSELGLKLGLGRMWCGVEEN